MDCKSLQKSGLLVFALFLGFSFLPGATWGAQESTFDWAAADNESIRLDPAGYHTGRVFKSGDQAGNVHVDIDAKTPVTVEMAPNEEWSEALRHPELLPRITFRCIDEHVTNGTFVCKVPPGRPMALVLRDERNNERAAEASFGASHSDHGTVRDFISPNDIHIQYYRWVCAENCNPPQYQWVSELREKYQVTPEMKIYDGIMADRDGEPFSIRVSSPTPMMVAIVPTRLADEARGKPGEIAFAVESGSCAQKGIQSGAFECSFDRSDGPLSVVAVPEEGKPAANRKVELEIAASKCVANCLTLTTSEK